MELLILLLLGGGAYWFFKSNTRRGAEVLRAHVYLMALQHDRTVEEANDFADQDMTELPTQITRLAKAHTKVNYHGVNSAMVADAYRQGMRPKLPLWERTSINHAFDTEYKAPPPNEHKPAVHQYADFDSYNIAYVAEVKRLAGTGPGELHAVDLLVDDGTRLAFKDGVPPHLLAKMFHQQELERQQQG